VRRLLIAISVVVGVMFTLRTSVAVDAQGPFFERERLPPCTGGPRSGAVAPPTGGPTEDVPRCRATPTYTTRHFRPQRLLPQRRSSDGLPVPSAGYHFNGTSTSTAAYNGVWGSLSVQNVTLDWSGNFGFLASWFMARPLSSQTKWIQVGWAENAWTGDRRHVFVYDTWHNVWEFHDQYTLIDGQFYYFAITRQAPNSNVWNAWLWWNNAWNLLHSAYLEMNDVQIDEYVEAYSNAAPGAPFGGHPGFPNLFLYDVYVGDNSGPRPWDTSIPTLTPSSVDPYCTVFLQSYYHGRVSWCAP
jgi:hypothetical protein